MSIVDEEQGHRKRLQPLLHAQQICWLYTAQLHDSLRRESSRRHLPHALPSVGCVHIGNIVSGCVRFECKEHGQSRQKITYLHRGAHELCHLVAILVPHGLRCFFCWQRRQVREAFSSSDPFDQAIMASSLPNSDAKVRPAVSRPSSITPRPATPLFATLKICKWDKVQEKGHRQRMESMCS